MTYKKKLIEVALPLDAINRESAREKSIRHGHPSTLHLWWARRPLGAARAVLWASLVDDPSAHPGKFSTEEAQEAERQRLFRILEELVKWENSNDERVLEAARTEIVASCDGDLPNILDPFCGGGTIPLEAQRLGLGAFGGDLNPVAVLVSKALTEIPGPFVGLPPVHPSDEDGFLRLDDWHGCRGLASDVRFYGELMINRARELIGENYPDASDRLGREFTPIAWIWARTVASPDPSWDGEVPLVRSWTLRGRKGSSPAVWVDAKVDREAGRIRYALKEGGVAPEGTVGRRGAVCLATGAPISFEYVRAEAQAGRMGTRLIGIVAESSGGRVYTEGDDLQEAAALAATPNWVPDSALPEKALGFRVQAYGMTEHQHLFTRRQLTALDAFSSLVPEFRDLIEHHALQAGMKADSVRLSDGGRGATAYADAVATYLAFAVDKSADYWSTIATWATGGFVRGTFARQALPMTWDFAEANPFSESSGSWLSAIDWIARAIDGLPGVPAARIEQRDAEARVGEVSHPVISTDPPYYDNIGYADLSDYFYVWLRRGLRGVWPNELSTLLTPKTEELIANRFRAGSPEAAKEHFERGMTEVFSAVSTAQQADYPATVFYAFKQEESSSSGTASTGWETFLEGLLAAGFMISATWPIRTERTARPVASGTAALASSIVIACRRRTADAPMATRSEFLAALRDELPNAVRLLQRGAVAPVDMAQSTIGPGMAVYSRFSKVIEADGSRMGVRQALSLINEILQEVLSEEETEFDGDTRWALTWFEQNGMTPGPYGDAETLSKAKNTSVSGVIKAGIARQVEGKVHLLGRVDLDDAWDPASDPRLTVWEVTQHLIAKLERSETEAADVLRLVGGGLGERARQLAYLLHRVADRRGWASEALAYNGLIQAWPDLAKLSGRSELPAQQRLGE